MVFEAFLEVTELLWTLEIRLVNITLLIYMVVRLVRCTVKK